MLENPVTSSGCVFQTFEKTVVWSSSQILSDETANSVASTSQLFFKKFILKILYKCLSVD